MVTQVAWACIIGYQYLPVQPAGLFVPPNGLDAVSSTSDPLQDSLCSFMVTIKASLKIIESERGSFCSIHIRPFLYNNLETLAVVTFTGHNPPVAVETAYGFIVTYIHQL